MSPPVEQIPSASLANRQALLAIRELKAKLARAEARQRAPIAIVGMACRLPGGCTTPDELWQLLREGRDAVGTAAPARWPEELVSPEAGAPGKIISNALGRLDSEGDFDPEFFHISPREAASMDPQQRLLLQVAWESCEDAGLTRERLHGSPTGIFVGIGNNDYADFELRHPDLATVSAHAGTGNATSLAAGRLAFFLGTQGPALVLDTACSSALVAVHQACASLRLGECRTAVVGGVNLVLRPSGSVFLSRFGALSPTGRCRAFAEAADGYVRAEGCVAIVLKPLEDAERDGDRIHAVIRGSAINHDGRSGGLTVPNGSAQRALLKDALANAGVGPERVGYLEAHGTGTPLGDPIEMGAIAAVYSATPRRAPLRVGSVKSNVGHTEAAAGIAGLVKAVLCLAKRQIPPHLHFDQPSSRIDWAMPVEIPTQLQAWDSDEPRVAGVSSFGFSGTNAHVVLEEAPPVAPARSTRTGAQILCLSTRHEASLLRLAQAHRRALDDAAASLADVCHNAVHRRTHHTSRLALVAEGRQTMGEALDDFLAGRHHPGVVRADARLDGMSKLAFVFSGQGSQWLGMGRDLLASEPVFAASLAALDADLHAQAGWSLLALLRGDDAARLERTRYAQPAIVAIQIALADLWRSLGVVPDAVLGHSLGEITAAHVAGVLTRQEAIGLADRRGCIMDEATGLGKMAELACSEAQARAALDGFAQQVSIAAVNGPATTVLAGPADALSAVIARLADAGVQSRWLRVDYAFHSPQMARFRAPFEAAVAQLKPRAPERALYSSVLGGRLGDLAMDAQYWGRNLADPVRFHPALVALLEDEVRAVVEVGPHPVLLPAVKACLADRAVDGVAAYTLRRGAPEGQSLLLNLGALHTAGYPVDWSAVYPGRAAVVDLPRYPWHDRRFWTDVVPAEATHATRAVADQARPAEARTGLRGELGAAPLPVRRARIERHVREQVVRILRLDPTEPVGKRTPLKELGMDSVTAVELCKALALEPGHEVPPTVLFDHPSIEKLTGFLEGELARLDAIATVRPSAPPTADLDQLAESEAERLILEKLATLEKEYS